MVSFRFDCVFYYVMDMDRGVDFYTNVLGLKLESRDIVTRFEIDGVLFELAPAPSEEDVKGGGNARLCLGVEDMAQAVEQLEGEGVQIRQVREVPGGILATFEDPDGNEIYLWQHR